MQLFGFQAPHQVPQNDHSKHRPVPATFTGTWVHKPWPYCQPQSRFQHPPKSAWQPTSVRRNRARCSFHLCGISEYPQVVRLSRMLFIKNRSNRSSIFSSPLLEKVFPNIFSQMYEISFGDSNVISLIKRSGFLRHWDSRPARARGGMDVAVQSQCA